MRFFRKFRSSVLTKQEEEQEQARLEDQLQEYSDEDRMLFMDARLGIEAVDFWNSDVGMYLRGACQTMMSDALMALSDCNPADYGMVAKAQVSLKAAQKLVRLVTAAIQSGDAAEKEIQLRGDNDEAHG